MEKTEATYSSHSAHGCGCGCGICGAAWRQGRVIYATGFISPGSRLASAALRRFRPLETASSSHRLTNRAQCSCQLRPLQPCQMRCSWCHAGSRGGHGAGPPIILVRGESFIVSPDCCAADFLLTSTVPLCFLELRAVPPQADRMMADCLHLRAPYPDLVSAELAEVADKGSHTQIGSSDNGSRHGVVVSDISTESTSFPPRV